MSTFAIKIDQNDLKQVKDMLGDIKGLPDRVCVRALNKTLTGVKTDISTEIRSVITAKKAAVDETIKIQKAYTGNMTAVISSTGKPLALIDYSARQTKKGISIQVRKDRPRKVVAGAFIASMKSGHKGVFWRVWHNKTQVKLNKTETAISRSGFVWSSKTNRYIPIAALPKSFRLPVKERFGPRIPDIMGNDTVMNNILDKAGSRLHDNLKHETEYEMSKIQ